jgi:hypothetical protein
MEGVVRRRGCTPEDIIKMISENCDVETGICLRNRGQTLSEETGFPGYIKDTELLDHSRDYQLLNIAYAPYSKFIPFIQLLFWLLVCCQKT